MEQEPQQQPRHRRRASAAAAPLAGPLPLLLLVAAAAGAALALLPPGARAAPVANIQSIHGCDCIGICDRGSAGRYNTPTCYINISSCNYLAGRQKAPPAGRTGKNTTAPYDRFAVPYEEIELPPLADGTALPPSNRFWDYCQDPTWVPRASNITTVQGCKCLELYQSAFGLLSNVSCLGTETDRPFCYIKKNSCPPGASPIFSDFYRKGSSAYAQYDYCQPYSQAVKSPPGLRTRNGCLCLEQYRWYEQVINGGTCVPGFRQFPGRLRCLVDPKTCDAKLMAANGGPYPSVVYRDMYFDLCD